MKHVLLVLGISIATLFCGIQTTHAADISLNAKSVAANSVTVTIKNKVPAGTNADGTYKSIVRGALFAVNLTTGSPENTADIGSLTGGQSKDITISNLNPLTRYSVEFQEGGGLYSATSVIKKVTMTTKQGTVFFFLPKVIINGTCMTPPTAPPAANQTPPSTPASPPPSTPAPTSSATTDQCMDDIDNQVGDGKDYGYGVNKGDFKADRYGAPGMEADPSCFSLTATVEKGDDLAYKSDGSPASVIPCTDKCTFGDVFRFLNNILVFFFKVLLAPIFIIVIIYAGYTYITAQGNSAKILSLRKALWNMVKGIIIILCSWLIVRTIMTTVLNQEFKNEGIQFLGD